MSRNLMNIFGIGTPEILSSLNITLFFPVLRKFIIDVEFIENEL